jgi:hypothetical protein
MAIQVCVSAQRADHGHLVGTRLLVGEPDELLQSGLIILRLLD